MAHTHKLADVAERIFDLIDANRVSLTLGDQGLWYGDQNIVPEGRTVCVEPVNVTRAMSGAPDMVTNTFTVAVLIYLTSVQDIQQTRRDCDQLSEDLEDLLHAHLSLDDGTPNSDIVVHGYVTENLSGYTYKNDRLIRSARLTWQGISKTSLRFGP